ncbi:MAG: LysR family transcriptional regulator [Bacteroides sp.]|nr:LysR family transcriptional regulator [Bacteroides sp.]
MTLQQLKYIIKIVECGSITEAAKQLFISQPSLSSALKEIEKEYGIEIFYRTPRGISLSADGREFLSYARQIVEQTQLMEQRYSDRRPVKQLCSVSTQHYSFAVTAFVKLIEELGADEYEFTLRETRTYDIIDDVTNFRSEIGIVYFSEFNEKVLKKLLKENHLKFEQLFEAEPHVFVSSVHPLSGRGSVTIDELDDYPFLCFEQGSYNSFYFSEEILSTAPHRKTIHVSDRATLFNLLIGLNGYTVCTGELNSALNGENIVSVRLETDETMRVGWISNDKAPLSSVGEKYVLMLKQAVAESGFAEKEKCYDGNEA